MQSIMPTAKNSDMKKHSMRITRVFGNIKKADVISLNNRKHAQSQR